ncbi:MAG: SagB/ThcOx family dehydrogenase [Persephonella sp.]|nr:SagB/ThcOx family dehydrogenase [Persephonella sp.]
MEILPLPEPVFDSDYSIEKVLLNRRSLREFSSEPLSLKEISQLLWAAQGITHFEGFRTAPSAGALYPLEVYAVCGNVKNVGSGIYHYNPFRHELILRKAGDYREELFHASLGQEWVRKCPVCFVITGIYDRTTRKYGSRGIRYVDMEAGHAAQNLLLQATAMEIGGVTVGAFYDNQVRKILDVEVDEFPLYLIPVGKK